MMIEIGNTPSANHLIWDSVTGGLWLGTGTGNDGFQPTYSVILKSVSVCPTDSLVSKSQMIDYVPAIDSIFDAFNNSDPNPGMNPEEWSFNELFT